MTRLRGRALNGQRLRGSYTVRPLEDSDVHRRPAQRRPDRTVDHRPADDEGRREVLEIYVETQFAPTLDPGDVVILDQPAKSQKRKAKNMLKQRAAWLLFLPRYNPDLNPIEMAFLKLKAHPRRIGARTIDDLWRGRRQHLRPLLPRRMPQLLQRAGYGYD